MSTTCAVCGKAVRVSKGVLIKHRIDGHVCDNSGCSAEANARAENGSDREPQP